MSEEHIQPSHILLTRRGDQWLKNFDVDDRSVARDLALALNLLSHNEFERGFSALIQEMLKTLDGPVALYGARELPKTFRFEMAESDKKGSIDATPRGGDIGSEGRIANIIRNLCREHPSKLLNHPTLKLLRQKQVEAILVLDDFIGSGKRTTDYLNALWRSRSIRSWRSYKSMHFLVAAYSATAVGTKRVEAHPCRPRTHLVRHCPTIDSLHWRAARIREVKKLCQKYFDRAGLKGSSMGFENTGALLVFEHGCPNNVPAIFWADPKRDPNWAPLFPSKRIDLSVVTAFPPEVVQRKPVHVLLEAGQKRLSAVLSSNAQRPLSEHEALVLALFAQGKRRIETLAAATRLTAAEAATLIERSIEAGWISERRRITEKGLAEIRGLRSMHIRSLHPVPKLGKDEYYPSALRGRDNG